MIRKKYPKYENIRTIVFDFDGIFTDNKVYINEEGIESIRCDRSDGFAFDLAKKFIKNNNWNVKLIVLTKERNKVVHKRCEKLGLECHSGVDNKRKFLLNKFSSNFNENKEFISGLTYLGNDLNDLESILISEFSFAPIDAHKLIKTKVDFVLDAPGGNGFIRKFFEIILDFDNMDFNKLIDIL
tara:strand:+ start:34017 stop:34568 length:552 start_codon:yes stop_codon:yes gene_type:complete